MIINKHSIYSYPDKYKGLEKINTKKEKVSHTLKQDTNTTKDYKSGFFNGNKIFNKYLVNFTGNGNNIVDKMKTLNIIPYDLEEIYLAANKLDTLENKAIKTYIFNSLKNVDIHDIAHSALINIATKAEDEDKEDKKAEDKKLEESLLNHYSEIYDNSNASYHNRAKALDHLGALAVETKNENLKKNIADKLIKKANDEKNYQLYPSGGNRYLVELGSNTADEELQNMIVTDIVFKSSLSSVDEKGAFYKTLGKIGSNTTDEELQNTITKKLFDATATETQRHPKTEIYKNLGKIGANTTDEELQNTIVKKLIDIAYDANSQKEARAAVYNGLGQIYANSKNIDIKKRITSELIEIAPIEKNMVGDKNKEAKQSVCTALARIWVDTTDEELKDQIYNELVEEKGNNYNYEALEFIGINTTDIKQKEKIVDNLEEIDSRINPGCKYQLTFSLREIVNNTDNEEFQNKIADKLIKIMDNAKWSDIPNIIENEDREDILLRKIRNAVATIVIDTGGFINENNTSLEALADIVGNTKDKDLQYKIVNEIKNNLHNKAPSIIQREIYKTLGNIGKNALDDNMAKEIYTDLINDIEKLDTNKSKTKATIITSLKNIALKKGYLPTDEKLKDKDGKEITIGDDNRPAFKIICRKVLEKVKAIADSTQNANVFTSAIVAQKELEEHEARDQKLLSLAYTAQSISPAKGLEIIAQAMEQGSTSKK